jgi:hypothetical protein
MNSTYNLASFVVNFRELHERLIASGFELVSVTPASASSMQHFYRRHREGETPKNQQDASKPIKKNEQTWQFRNRNRRE